MELFKAASQWSTRPADERFASLADLFNACKSYADTAREKNVPYSALRVEASEKDVQLVGKAGIPAKLTHWAFGQLSARIGAPASYLRTIPATLAAQNLNYGLAQLGTREPDEQKQASLLFHQNGSLLLRAITSEQYSRIWNWEVAERLLSLQSKGWAPAKPTSHWGSPDVGKCIMCSGSGKSDGPMGDTACQYCKGTGSELPALYASDHDCFIFMMAQNVSIPQPVTSSIGSDLPLYRGMIVENSEVGARALKLTRFLFNAMCGNHIIWGASKIVEVSIRHVGEFARGRFDSVYSAEFRRYAEQGAQEETEALVRARNCYIAGTKEEVLDKLFGMRALSLSRKTLNAGYDAVIPDQDGSPNTVWGMVQGLTRHSQTLPYADSRTEVDKAAGKLLEVEF